MNNKPNLLLIITDQQSATMMGCAGNQYVKTPAMDWLANSGVRFDQAYCTNPVCVPSRFSLMTGRYPSAINQRSNNEGPVDEEKAAAFYRDGLGGLLRKAGYETLYAGKQHLPRGTAEDCGFEVLEKNERALMANRAAEFIKSRTDNDQPFALVTSFINPHDICYMALQDCASATPADDESLGFVKRSKDEVPCVNRALELPEDMGRDEFFANVCPPLPGNHLPQVDAPEGIQHLLDERPFRRLTQEIYDEERWRLHRWAYANLTLRVDSEISVVLEALRATGQDRDTVIIFTSDHGDHDSSHLLENKTIPYQEAVRIPLILRPAGGLEKGIVDKAHLVCNGLDILPTLCDYAGAEIPDDLQGQSLRPFAEGNNSPGDWRTGLLIESQNSLSINTGEWQYTLFDRGENREQLYDLKNDPGQTRNHIAEPAHKEILERHRQLLKVACPSSS